MRYAATATIDAPADVVWQAVQDVEKWSDWTPTITEIQVHGGGRLAVGSVATVRQPKQATRDWTVTELVDGQSFTWVSRGPGLRFFADHIVTTTDDGTMVELSFGVAGPMAWLASMMAGKWIRTTVDKEAALLKKWCERTLR